MIADLVQDTTTTTGTGNITLSGSPAAGFQALSALGGVGITFGYWIGAGSEWEVGTGTITAANTFSRAPTASSNSGALVAFSAGTKTFRHVVTASQFNQFLAPSDIIFTTTVPLTNPAGAYMTGMQSVTGALTFTPAASPVRGAFSIVALKANGTNIPDVSAFTEHGSSMGYLNTANILNIANFFYLGGVAWVSWSQALTPVAMVAPTLVTMTGPTTSVVNTASSNYTVNTDGVRTAPVTVTPTPVTNVTFTPSSVTLPVGSAPGTFTATSTTTGAKTIAVTNSAGLTNPSNIPLTVAAAATAPGAPTIGTATGGDTTLSQAGTAPASDGGSAITGYQLKVYKVSDDSLVGTFTNATLPVGATGLTNGVAVYGKLAATNAVGTGAQSAASNSVTPAVASNPDRFGALVLTTESGTGPYSYVGDATGVWDNPKGGIYQKKFANGVDGAIKIRVDAYSAGAGNFVMIGLTTSATPVSFPTLAAYFYTNASSGIYSGSNGAQVNAIAPASGDIMYMRRVGTTIYLDVSKDGGSTFTTAWQLPLASTAFNIQVIPNKSGAWTTVSSTGLV